jgi:hypothetical protein
MMMMTVNGSQLPDAFVAFSRLAAEPLRAHCCRGCSLGDAALAHASLPTVFASLARVQEPQQIRTEEACSWW